MRPKKKKKKKKVQVTAVVPVVEGARSWSDRAGEPYLIDRTLVCRKCLLEVGVGNVMQPAGPVLRAQKLMIGFVGQLGFQVWCMKHHCNVLLYRKDGVT